MLYFTLRCHDEVRHGEASQYGPAERVKQTEIKGTWHVGTKPPAVLFEPVDQVRCIFIQADGDELDYIQDHFSGLPFANKKVVGWTGDLADFILRNL